MMQPLLKAARHDLNKSKAGGRYDPAVLLLGIYIAKENEATSPKVYLHPVFIMYNSQDIETTMDV